MFQVPLLYTYFYATGPLSSAKIFFKKRSFICMDKVPVKLRISLAKLIHRSRGLTSAETGVLYWRVCGPLHYL